MNIMNYFFYKDYMFNKMIKHAAPLFVSAIMVSVIEFVNFILIISLINKYVFEQTFNTNLVLGSFMIVGIISFAINTLYYTKNLERICNKYKGESNLKNIFGYVFYIIYFIGSIAILLILGEKLGLHL
jgi:hypothetical protein